MGFLLLPKLAQAPWSIVIATGVIQITQNHNQHDLLPQCNIHSLQFVDYQAAKRLDQNHDSN
jgi:hypothetical protein